MKFYDAHNHLQDERFADRQDELVAVARDAGVERMVVNGTCAQDWPKVAELARRFPGYVLPAFGLHPWFVSARAPDWEQQLARWLEEPGATIGEIGLDRWKADLPWADQEEVFLRQLALAAKLNRPVSIHCLKAWGPLCELLERSERPARGFLLHSYSGSSEVARRLLSLGAFFSLSGHLREVFRHIPLERVLIETDAPDQLLPEDLRRHMLTDPKTGSLLNHPAHTREVYEAATALLKLPLPALCEQVERNFTALFG